MIRLRKGDCRLKPTDKDLSSLTYRRETVFTISRDGHLLHCQFYPDDSQVPDSSGGEARTIFDLFPRDLAERQMTQIGRVFDTGEIRTLEIPITIQGRSCHLRASYRPVNDLTGSIASVIGVVHDVTELVQARDELRRERDFVRSLIDSANSLIICLDEDGRITEFNREIEEITGYRREEVLGRVWRDIFLPPDHYSHSLENFGNWVREHPRDSYEGPLIARGGEVRTIHWSTSAVFYPDSDDFIAFAVGRDITERKHGEAVLSETRERFRQVLEYSRDILYRFNVATGSYDYISDSVGDVLGYTPEEIISRGADGMRLLTHPDDLTADGNYRERLLDSPVDENSLRFREYRLRNKKGDYVWLGDSHAVVRDKAGQARYIIGNVRDITARKEAENLLREKEERYELATRAARVGVWDWNIETGAFYLDPSVVANLGYSIEEFGTDWEAWAGIIHEDDRSNMESAARDHVDKKTPEFNVDYRVRDKNGTMRWIASRGRTLSDRQGRAVRLIGTSTEITERKEMARALEESEIRYRELFDSAMEGVAFVDEHDIVRLCNKSFAGILGENAPEDVIGSPLIAYIPEDQHEVLRKQNVLRRQNESSWYELDIILKSGVRKNLLLSVSPRFSADGEYRGAFGTAIDISDRIVAEKALACQLQYEKGLAACSETLLLAGLDEKQAIDDALAHLLVATEVSRVYVFENIVDPDRGLCMNQIHEVCAAGVETQMNNPDLQAYPYQRGTPRWRDTLSRGGIIKGAVRDFPDIERRVLEPQGIISMLVLPIRVDGAWYGFIGFDDTNRDRAWGDEEIRLLRTAADILGGFIGRRRGQKSLAESEGKYRLLVDNVQAAIALIDFDGKFLFANEVACRSFGLGEIAFVGKKIEDVFPGNLADRHLRAIRGVIDTGQVFSNESQTSINGEWRWYHVTLSPFGNAGRKNNSAMLIAHEITERKRTEIRDKARLELLDNLRTTMDIDACLTFGCRAIFDAELFRRAVLTLHDEKRAIINLGQVGLDEKVIEAARRAPAPSEEISRRMTQDKFRISHSYFVPEEATTDIELSDRYISQNDCLRQKEQSWYSGDELFVPIMMDTERFEGWLSVDTPFDGERPSREIIHRLEEVVDIVTQKVREIRMFDKLRSGLKALGESEERFRMLADLLPQGVFELDGESRLIFLNRFAISISGYDAAELDSEFEVGRLFIPEDRPRLGENIRRVLDGETLNDIEYTALRKDGHKFPVSIFTSPIFKDGRRCGARGIVFDITERKQAAERVREIEHEKYEQAKQTAGIFAHEIRNALFPAVVALNKLKKNHSGLQADGKLEKYAGIAEKAVTRAADITRLISSFTKLGSEISPERVKPAEVVAELLLNNQMRLKDDGVVVEVAGDDEVVVLSNQRQLRQALNNLMINSLDALTETAEPRIFIAWKRDSEGIIFRFEDNGGGIPDDSRERVFDPFYSTKIDSGGSGLGLAMVKKIVEMYDGRISIGSQPGRGAIFNIIFTPADRSEE